MDAICVLFLLSSPLKSSFSSVVLDFSASLNDAAPASPMLLSVDLMKVEKSELFDGYHLCVISFVFTIQIELSECCVRFQYITQ